MKQQTRGSLMLLLCAMVWGAAFVAQSEGMNYVGPFTMQAARYFLAGLVLVPVIFLRDKKGISVRPAGRHGAAPIRLRRNLRRDSLRGQHHPAIRHHPHDGRKIRLHHHHVYHPRPLPRSVREAPREAYELGLRDPRAHGTLSSVCRRRGPLRGQLRRLADASVRSLFRVPYSLYRPRVP